MCFHAKGAAVIGLAGLVMTGWTGGAVAEARLPDHLKSVNGRTIRTGELAAGGALLVVTVKGAWCRVCREQVERLKKIQAQLDVCGAEVLVITPDPNRQALEFQKAVGDRYPVVSDPNGEVGRILGVWDARQKAMFPALFLFGRELSLQWSIRGRAPGLFADEELMKHLDCDGRAA